MADLLAQIAKRISGAHALPESERPSLLRTVVSVAAPFAVLAAVVAVLMLTV